MTEVQVIKGYMPKRVVIETTHQGEESFGERLKRLRQGAKISLRDLAKQVGVSHRMLFYYESKQGNPPVDLLPILAKALGVSADTILGLDKSTNLKPRKVIKRKSK